MNKNILAILDIFFFVLHNIIPRVKFRVTNKNPKIFEFTATLDTKKYILTELISTS